MKKQRGIIFMEKKKGGFATFTLDDYDITCDGRIINLKWGGREVKPQLNGKGYLRVKIAGKLRFVHRLVAEKYVPNPNKFQQVNHKDGDKYNNRADNLEWVSNAQNRKHAIEKGLHVHGEKCPWAKLTKADVLFIREHPDAKTSDLSKMFGVAHSTIRCVRANRSWK